MAVILPKSVFYHLPKTGGLWVEAALRSAKVPFVKDGKTHSLSVPEYAKDYFSFSFVRHPASFYISRWRCPFHRRRIASGSAVRKWPDAITPKEAADFNVWLRSVMDRFPSLFTKKCARWADHCNFVGKQENLREDLISALHQAGEEFDEEAIRNTRRQNQGSIPMPIYKRDLYDEMMEKESRVLEKYGYDNIPLGFKTSSDEVWGG